MDKRKETLNKLAEALIAPSFNATHEYMKAQMDYSKNISNLCAIGNKSYWSILSWIAR